MSSKTRQKESIGISRRAYAKRVRVAHSYINRLVARGVIVPLANGKIDPDQADRARQACTEVGFGQRRSPAQDTGPERLICEQCGDPNGYTLFEAQTLSSGDPARWCCGHCSDDAVNGASRAQTRRGMLLHLLAEHDEIRTRADVKRDPEWSWLLE